LQYPTPSLLRWFGVEADISKAILHFEMACDEGYGPSCDKLLSIAAGK
jgi:TPR repeat protein